MEIITEAQRWAQALKPGLKCHKKKNPKKQEATKGCHKKTGTK